MRIDTQLQRNLLDALVCESGVDSAETERFEAAVLHYSHALYRAAFRQLHNREDAEDAVQDALVSAFKHISRFQGRSCISTWLHRIVINSARMQIRRQRGRVFVSLDGTGPDGEPDLMHELPDSALSPDQSYEQTELRALVYEVVNLLPVRLRSALQLRYLQDFTTTESANVLGVSRGTAKSRVHRAKAKLTTLLAARGLLPLLVENERSKRGQLPIFGLRNRNPLQSTCSHQLVTEHTAFCSRVGEKRGERMDGNGDPSSING